VLWVSGARLTDMGALAEIEDLRSRGALVELEPSPITGPAGQHFQCMCGVSPAHFGFFDELVPHCHLPAGRDESRYALVETGGGGAATPKMLPDLLKAKGWEVTCEEALPARIRDCVQGVTRSDETDSTAPKCRIVKCVLDASGTLGPLTGASREAIAHALRAAHAWVGETGLLALMSDIGPAPVETFINVNNFLAEMEVLDRNTQSGQIDWQSSLAYYAGHGQLWINLLGRDPQGVVHPHGEYEEVRDSLVRGLPARLRDSTTGTPVVEKVYRKEELYPEEYLFCAPDLVVVFKPGYAPSPASVHMGFDEAMCTPASAGSLVMAGAHPSMHRGFFLLSAPTVVPGRVLPEAATLTSALPTLLHALDVQHAGMDGQVLGGVFSLEYLETHPIAPAQNDGELSDEDEELIINRLRDLGYV
jgi:Type I phosphodiesterase / nucleotide pyrophosphatase